MFFESWFGIWRIFISSLVVYFILIFFLRISGKRTLSKWNAFDFIVTIALGSTLATVLTSKDLVILEGMLSLGLLVGLQFIITWISVPTLMLRDGKFIEKALIEQRVTESEILAAIRSNGQASKEDIAAVILETDGSFSVISKAKASNYSAMSDVTYFRDDEKSSDGH